MKNKNSYLMQNVTPNDTPDTLLTPFESARFWIELGIAVIPVVYRDKRPDSRLLPDHKWDIYQSKLPTYTELAKWFGSRFHNLGIVTGWRNLVVIDFDDHTQYVKWQLWLARRPGIGRIADLALQVRTARGVHVYFMTQIPAQNAKLDGIDVKARNGYVLGAGSVHPTGAVYSIMSGRFPALIESLSDVLPADLLVTHTEYSDVVNAGALPVVSVDDPWHAAENVFNPSEDLIMQLKRRYRIEHFLKIDDRSNRRWLMTRCPFHDDASPSFWVDSARQLCGCFAGCTPKPYDVIDLYARLHSLTVKDAILVMMRGVQ